MYHFFGYVVSRLKCKVDAYLFQMIVVPDGHHCFKQVTDPVIELNNKLRHGKLEERAFYGV